MSKDKSLTERVTINFSPDDLKAITEARQLLSQDLANFIRGATLEKARSVLMQLRTGPQRADA